jgi:hypothetical protein
VPKDPCALQAIPLLDGIGGVALDCGDCMGGRGESRPFVGKALAGFVSDER